MDTTLPETWQYRSEGEISTPTNNACRGKQARQLSPGAVSVL